MQKKLLNSRDHHPAVVIDDDRYIAIEVFVGGNHQRGIPCMEGGMILWSWLPSESRTVTVHFCNAYNDHMYMA